MIDAVEALRALPDQAARDAATVALFLDAPDNSEALFARLAALAGTPYADLVSSNLASELMRAGVWGLAREHAAADPLVLASALRFAMRTGDVSGAGTILYRLATLARANGSFGFGDNPDDLALTAEIVRSLDGARGIPAADALASGGRQWLRLQANADLSALPSADVALLLLTVGPLDSQLLRTVSQELQARQALDGSFDGGDVRSTSLAIQALTICLPDLHLTPSGLDLAQAISGSPFARTVVVSNDGLTSSATTTIDYRVTGPDGGELLAGSAPVPALAPGQTLSVSLDLGVQGAVGARVLTAIVNSGAAFPELNLDNNVAAMQFEVLGLPDLVIDTTDLSATPVPPPLHQAIDVTVRVRNVGSALARNVHVQLPRGIPLPAARSSPSSSSMPLPPGLLGSSCPRSRRRRSLPSTSWRVWTPRTP